MAARYDDAVAELHQVPHGSFVTERKRLAGELKAAGDKPGAATLGKLPRPPISAWAVNQLWWHARDAFDAMLETAAKLRDGDLGAAASHRDTLAKLRARAAAILGDAGHGATESTLRRVMTTLAAIAATGGFAPDPPGALGDDRDPPGFETMGIAPERAPPQPPPATSARAAAAPPRGEPTADDTEAAVRRAASADADERRRRDAEDERARAAAAAERRRGDQEAARRHAERQRVEAALRTAAGEVERRARDVVRLRSAVEQAEASVHQARAIVADLEAKLAELAELAELA